MLELSACIEWLFADEPRFADRIGRAAAAGLGSVEFWTWRDKDLPAVSSALSEAGVTVAGFVSQPEGRPVDPLTHEEVVDGVSESARVAQSLGCGSLLVLAGDGLESAADSEQRRAVVHALRRAAPVAAERGVRLLLEPLNTRIDHVGHFLDATDHGLGIVEDVDAANVLLLLDLYHSAVMGEALDEVVGDRIGLVGHVHVADTQGRHEPGTGDIDWPATVSWLRRARYSGYLGLEYQPTCGTAESFRYLEKVIASTI